MAQKYPVAWRGKTYHMTPLTRGQKKEYCEWLIAKRREEIVQDFRKYPDVLNTQMDGLRARIWWSASVMSPAVFDSIRSPDGGRKWIRMLMGVKENELTEEELEQLMDEKEAEQRRSDEELEKEGKEPPYPPANDYSIALLAISEEMNPKASGPESGSGPTQMP